MKNEQERGTLIKKNSQEAYRKATEYMKERLFEKVYVTEIAQYCGVSNSGLKKTFAKYAQTGVMRYFLDLKLEYAAKMLRKGYTVGYLAKQLHFSSTAHLSMAFKKKYGVSPLKYKYPTMI